MALFRRKERVIDLSEKYRRQQEQLNSMKEESNGTPQSSEQPTGIFPFFNASPTPASSEPETEEYLDVSGDAREKKKRLAKRLMDMTEKIEDLTNQIYHLQQRIEVLEKKSGSGY